MKHRISPTDVLRAPRSLHVFVRCLLLGVLAWAPLRTASAQQPTLTACVGLLPTALSLNESNAPGEYEALLRLTTLAADQTVYVVPTILSSDPSVTVSISPTSLEFTMDDIPNTGVASKKFRVAVRPDDDAVGGEAVISHAVIGPNCEQEAGNVTITVTDPGAPVPGLTLSKESLIVAEALGMAAALEGEYTLSLASYPSGDVSIELTSSDSMAAKAAPKKLTFTQDNWFVPRTIAVTPVDDDDGDDEDVTISHEATGGGYDNVALANVSVRVIDPDPFVPSPGVTVSETNLELYEGQTTTYTIRLNTDPGSSVFILSAASDVAAVKAVPAVLEFTGGALTTDNVDTHWSLVHTVTVTANEDANAFSEMVTIQHSVSSVSADAYADLSIGDVMVQVWDDEARSVNLSEAALVVDEGKSATYTVVLGSRPLNTVVVTPKSSAPDKASVTPEALRFTTANWNEPQTVTLKGVRDADSGTDTATITHTAADGGYDNVAAADLTVVVTDTGTIISAEDAGDTLPTDFALEGNYPNPFNPSTEIAYSLPAQVHVTLAVYDVSGREVRRLVDAAQPAGRYQVRWDGTNAQGSPVRSGVYFYRLTTENWSKTQSMVLLK